LLSGPALLARAFFDRPSDQVAPDLLGRVLEHETADGLVAVEVTEVEAYAGEADPASHAWRGQTPRTAVMYGPPGYAYVYFTYGMHFCVNLVCLPAGTASAVLLRAGKIVAGEAVARARRARQQGGAQELARGPARLCQALAIDRALNGADVCDPGSPLRIRAGNGVAGSMIRRGPRIGVSRGADTEWRFWLDAEPTVSAYRGYVRRSRLAVGSLAVPCLWISSYLLA
jgi:DNA-3-methyladenine glycosylase